MARPGQIDHVAVGTSQMPEKLRADRVMRYLTVYLQQFNIIEEVTQQVSEDFFLWRTLGEQKNFVLNAIGVLLDQPKPDGFTNDEYSFILQARVLARKSSGTYFDILRVATFLGRGNPVAVFRVVPQIVVVTFQDLNLTAQYQSLYRALLLDTLGAVEGLDVQFVTDATAHYDVDPYDEGLYA